MSKVKTVQLEKKQKKLSTPVSYPEVRVEKGPLRSFLVTEPAEELARDRSINGIEERTLLALLLAFTTIIRMYRIPYPDSVVFDEVHFGGFSSKYIKGTFFMDVHPPLAKMLFAGIASLAGFKGDFGFESIADAYPSNVPYVLMRSFSAILGVGTVLLTYLTVRASGVSKYVALLGTLCFAVENSFVTISRYILLDSPLIFFIAAAVYSYKRFELYNFGTMQSYKALFATGMSLGLAVSSKWVGLFTIFWIGSLCIWRIWFQVGDLTVPVKSIVRQSIIKIIFLLGIPAVLYAAFFQMHFQALSNYSDGAGFYSSEFRTTLNGNTIPASTYADVGIGSTISLRHVGTMGGYLHSHNHAYETGSKQQQITLYPHLDQNNDWIVEYYNATDVFPTKFEGLADRTKIRLRHILTNHRLHSHDHKPPVSESSDWQKEVSGYGFEGFSGDANDDWVIEIDKDASAPGEAQKRVIAIETKFRLRHAMAGCLLFSHEVKLPKWGFEQQEVTCASQGKPHLTLWYVEGNTNPLLPLDAPKMSYKRPSFWAKLLESHKRMWHINKNLKEPHVYQSEPATWPFLLRGISYWSKDNRQVYFMGNMIVWWSVTMFLAVFSGVIMRELVSWQLGKPILQDPKVINFHIQAIQYILGFVIHYAPSFLMGRQLFLHHYLPAYYFGILTLIHALDIVVNHIMKRRALIAYAIIGAFVAATVSFFIAYSPLIYGLPWTASQCKKSQLASGWDYNCGTFLSSYEEYKSLYEGSQSSGQTVIPTVEALASSSTAEEEDIKNINIDSIIADPGPKKFIDQNGNELSPEHVEKLLKQGNGFIKSVSKEVIQN